MLKLVISLLVAMSLVLPLSCGKKSDKNTGVDRYRYTYANDPNYNPNAYPNAWSPNNGYSPYSTCNTGCGQTSGYGVYCPGVGQANAQSFFSSCMNQQNMPAVYWNGGLYPSSYFGQMMNGYYNQYGNGSGFQNWMCGSQFSNAGFYAQGAGTFGGMCGSSGLMSDSYSSGWSSGASFSW